MLARTELDPQEALVCTMVLVGAAETQGITDREIGVMATLVQTLPAFEGFSAEQLQHAIDATINLLREEDGLTHAGRLIREALEPRLRETAYTLGLRGGRRRPRARPGDTGNAGVPGQRAQPGHAGGLGYRAGDAG